MARIKGGVNAKKKHNRVLKLAKGYRGARSKQYRVAKQSVMRALASSYAGRKEKEARKKQKVIEIKEIRLSPNIDTNDLNTKVNAARKFITKGDRVKVTLRFRGREMTHMNNSKHILDDFAQALSDIAVVDKAPKVEGRSMTMFLAEKR